MIRVLNRLEFYAASANLGILDDSLLKRLNFTNYTILWDAVKIPITKARELKGETLFKDLEIMIARWKKHPLTVNEIK